MQMAIVRTGANPVIVHFIPMFDDAEHALSMNCSCSPRRGEDDERSIVHNSFDGREAFERHERLPS